jgi:hypothetical protein
MNAPVVTLDDHLRIAIEGNGQRLAAQLNQDNARQLGIALIELAGKDIGTLPSIESSAKRNHAA